MPIAIKKCKFFIIKTEFIGFIIKLGQIRMDLKKVQCILKWKTLENIIQVRLFLGFINFYQRFINQWLVKVEPLIRLTKKNKL